MCISLDVKINSKQNSRMTDFADKSPDHIDRVRAQWTRERPDLNVTPMGMLGRLSHIHSHLSAGMLRVFKAHGLNLASFDVLATLRRAGPPYALTPSALIDWTMVTSGTMTNRLDRLEAEGLISRRPNPDDGRGSVVGLTDKGFALIDEIMAEHVANQQAMVDCFSEAEQTQLDGLLRRWLAHLEPDTHR